VMTDKRDGLSQTVARSPPCCTARVSSTSASLVHAALERQGRGFHRDPAPRVGLRTPVR
jgi:hypothetical protein